MRRGASARAAGGQATPEWIGLVLLASGLLAAAVAAGVRLPGLAIAETIGRAITCAARLGNGCDGTTGELSLAYGERLARTVAKRTPELRYERGMHAVPVDFRSCREDPCANGPDFGRVVSSFDGEAVTAFTHVVDCRGAGPGPAFVCSGPRAGSVYVQYWLYWPGSRTSRELYGAVGEGAHDDDWESFQVRIKPSKTDARASSHHGYNYGGGPSNWLSDTGISHRSAWDADEGTYYISGGSHAGHVSDDGGRDARWTPGAAIKLVPIESLGEADLATGFAITPPWRKNVYSDPESQGT